MTGTNITGRLIVKGNVYFLGAQFATSDSCNFDPTAPNQLISSWNGKVPNSAVNVINDATGDLGTFNSNCYDSYYAGSAVVNNTNIEDLYCTGRICAIGPCRRMTEDDEIDKRQPTYGDISTSGWRQTFCAPARAANLPS